jgi:hypothetical protein
VTNLKVLSVFSVEVVSELWLCCRGMDGRLLEFSRRARFGAVGKIGPFNMQNSKGLGVGVRSCNSQSALLKSSVADEMLELLQRG